MASLTKIVVVIPLINPTGSSSETWKPMAKKIFGGFTVSMLERLVLFPVKNYFWHWEDENGTPGIRITQINEPELREP
jgi:multidrug efflux pump subunit AcrB